MPDFPPELLARWTGGRWVRPPLAPIAGFSNDTRQIRPGQMFIALKTKQRDGHQFLAAAGAAGAAAALVAVPDPRLDLPQLVVEDPLASFQKVAQAHRRQFRGPVVGITGSAGKTSTKDLLALLLGGAADSDPSSASSGADDSTVLATWENLNNHIGVPLTLTRLEPARHRFAVVEAGISAPGEMAPLAAMIEPDMVIVTLVGPAHLAALLDEEGVAREKAGLASAVRPGGLAIFPQACFSFAAFRALRVPTLAVGPAPAPIVFSVTQRPGGTELALGGELPETGIFSMRGVAEGMAQNAALALSAALLLGVPAVQLRERLKRWQSAPLRGEWRRDSGRLLYLDCYNANPAAMADALAIFKRTAPAELPRLFIIGGMEELGAGSSRYHEQLGRSLLMRPEDFLCLLGETSAAVRTGAAASGARPDQMSVASSIAEVAARLAAFSGAVFIKGSRKYQLERLVGAGPH